MYAGKSHSQSLQGVRERVDLIFAEVRSLLCRVDRGGRAISKAVAWGKVKGGGLPSLVLDVVGLACDSNT